MAQKQKILNPIALITAEIGALLRLYPDGVFITRTPKSFSWTVEICPTPLSMTYRIRLDYRYKETPKVFVTDPFPLDKYPGNNTLPHVYSTTKQQICLYYPKAREWNHDMIMARTIVPWASEWLLFYELWLSTGVWLGEGVHPIKDKKEENKKEK